MSNVLLKDQLPRYIDYVESSVWVKIAGVYIFATTLISSPGPPCQVSISSTFYACVFCTKFWRQKLQSFVLALRLFGAKILYKKLACKTLISSPLVRSLTPYNRVTTLALRGPRYLIIVRQTGLSHCCSRFLELHNSIFRKNILFHYLNTETISHITIFIQIFARNGTILASLENIFEFPTKVLVLTSHQSLKIILKCNFT